MCDLLWADPMEDFTYEGENSSLMAYEVVLTVLVSMQFANF